MKSDANEHAGKVWTAISRLLIIQISDHCNKIKRNYFQAVAVSVLLTRGNTKTLLK